MKLTKEQVINVIMEGVDDPGILKCVFMAGGPGSGKSYTAKELFGVGKEYTNTFSSTGLKVINSDTAFEKGLRDNGIDPKDLARIEKDEPELWDKITRDPGGIRSQAKKLTQKQQSFYEAGRLGMIIDGTGDDFNKIKKKVQHAKSLGYDCYMMFVNTSLEVALERNEKRDRTLPEPLVTQIWKDCQQNLGKFQGLFGGNMTIVDNTVYKPIDSQVQKVVDRFIQRPIYNPIGKEWVKTARALKKARLIKSGKEMNNKPSLKEKLNLFLEENVPTDPEKWSYAKSQAKKKFDVYPSAYANAWASKKYKELGGGWRKGKKSEGVNEAGLKGTENIPANKKLSQLSDTDKLKIVQGTGNLISFKIPSWSKDKKWTVISSGKIVKKKNLNGETIFFLQGKGGIIKASPTYPSVKELLDGVNWDTMELRRESVNEGLFSDIMKGVKKGSSPYSLVVIQNNKVVKQVETNTDRAIPAHFTTLKKEYPNSRIRVEDSTGKIVFEK
jgi:tRNA uridine 5-carbamoylmethylation protein Kti12